MSRVTHVTMSRVTPMYQTSQQPVACCPVTGRLADQPPHHKYRTLEASSAATETTHGTWKPVVHDEALHLLPKTSCVLCLPAMRGNSTCCCRYNADVFGRIYDVNGEAAIDDVGVD